MVEKSHSWMGSGYSLGKIWILWQVFLLNMMYSFEIPVITKILTGVTSPKYESSAFVLPLHSRGCLFAVYICVLSFSSITRWHIFANLGLQMFCVQPESGMPKALNVLCSIPPFVCFPPLAGLYLMYTYTIGVAMESIMIGWPLPSVSYQCSPPIVSKLNFRLCVTELTAFTKPVSRSSSWASSANASPELSPATWLTWFGGLGQCFLHW